MGSSSADVVAVHQTNCETLGPSRLVALCISGMPSRVALIVTHVIGIAKSYRKGAKHIGR
jgi:hypothetical protein